MATAEQRALRARDQAVIQAGEALASQAVAERKADHLVSRARMEAESWPENAEIYTARAAAQRAELLEQARRHAEMYETLVVRAEWWERRLTDTDLLADGDDPLVREAIARVDGEVVPPTVTDKTADYVLDRFPTLSGAEQGLYVTRSIGMSLAPRVIVGSGVPQILRRSVRDSLLSSARTQQLSIELLDSNAVTILVNRDSRMEAIFGLLPLAAWDAIQEDAPLASKELLAGLCTLWLDFNRELMQMDEPALSSWLKDHGNTQPSAVTLNALLEARAYGRSL